jgi:hypothetical protein
MTKNYNRTEILNFYELTSYQKAEILQDMEISEAEQKSYVIIKEDENETALPLDMFIRTEKNNFTHAIFSLSYFSGYFLTLSRCGTQAVIAYKYF